MTYAEAMQVMNATGVLKPALAVDGGSYHVISGTRVIGSGRSYKGALIAAKLLPRDSGSMTPRTPFAAVGSDVLHGTRPVCVARSPNMARRISNALNSYQHNDRGL
jgi:hypothetical protein